MSRSEKWLSTKTRIGLYRHVLPCILVYCTCIDMYRSVCMLYVPAAPEPRVWIVPVTSILGRLPLVPVGDAGTIPFSMASHKQQCFPGGTCDRADAPGSGSKLFYINTWAMVWPSDHPVLAEWCVENKTRCCCGLANPNQYQPIRTNTCEYMNNTYIIHTQYILSEFGLYWAQSLYSFVLTFVLQTKYKLNTYRYMPIHVHTCNTYCVYGDKTCGRHGVRIHANTRKYMPNTSKIHANTYQYETHDDHRFCPRHECIGYVLACICLYLACM